MCENVGITPDECHRHKRENSSWGARRRQWGRRVNLLRTVPRPPPTLTCFARIVLSPPPGLSIPSPQEYMSGCTKCAPPLITPATPHHLSSVHTDALRFASLRYDRSPSQSSPLFQTPSKLLHSSHSRCHCSLCTRRGRWREGLM